ncbi:MAG: hypothetical protein IJZ32_04405 [Clostridia bacterium]|nr:hypothetical protein [Clostridia bacterium]
MKAKRLIISCLSCVLFLSGCTYRNSCSDTSRRDGPFFEHPEFKTDYTIEEHIERISTLTEENFANELASGELVSYNVEILYAFYDEDPEYFLIELEYAEERSSSYETCARDENKRNIIVQYKTKYMHMIGFIKYDKYYHLRYIYAHQFVPGRSSYRYYGYTNNKKYVGAAGLQAVEKDGQIIKLFSPECIRRSEGNSGHSPEFHTHGESTPCVLNEVVSEDSYDYLMEGYPSLMITGSELYK